MRRHEHLDGNEALVAGIQQLMTAMAVGRAMAPSEPWLQAELSMGQLRALLVVHHAGTLRVGALARELHLSPNATTAVLDRLEQAGLLERHADPSDRRAVLVRASTAGTAEIDGLLSAGMQHLETRLRRLAPADLQALYRGMAALLRAMQEEQDVADGAPTAIGATGAERADERAPQRTAG